MRGNVRRFLVTEPLAPYRIVGTVPLPTEIVVIVPLALWTCGYVSDPLIIRTHVDFHGRAVFRRIVHEIGKHQQRFRFHVGSGCAMHVVTDLYDHDKSSNETLFVGAL